MNWTNVRLILAREIRDQLRDRRTLFMIAVLPLMLYPLLGMSFFQITQFMREHAIRVLVIGAPAAPDLPPLVEDDHVAANLGHEPLLQLIVPPQSVNDPNTKHDPFAQARREMQRGNYEVVVYFPPDFADRFTRFHESLLNSVDARVSGSDLPIPSVEIYPNLAKDSSRLAYRRVSDVLDRWRDEIGRKNLRDSHVAPAAAKPFEIATWDVAADGQHEAVLWSKILPFVLLIWALTGAFYPAIDLCAGEKERGTLETLLSSPAERLEIVWGKLLTIMLFSMATAILNLVSMSITGSFVLSQLPNFGLPSGVAIIWLFVALVPMAAFFSALCLALAAFARSTKEGQYYLMPLMLVTMPLTILPMAPGVELNVGSSLIPVTGVVLLLRTMLEGNYWEALPYIPLVVAVTLACCLLAIRWATNQFNAESVLFREGERGGVGLWLKHLLRYRGETPSVGEAVFCGVLILMVRFFLTFALPAPQSFRDVAVLATITQLLVVAAPALVMTFLLTRSPRQTLLLRRPVLASPLAAVLLALAIHPAVNLLQTLVTEIYPLGDQLKQALNNLFLAPDDLWIMLLVLCVLPAICEELAFRGFILSGLRHGGRKWTAIVVSSLFFGATHAIFQQSLIACLVGMVIGFLAVQSGSLLPGVLFHVVHNSIGVLVQQVASALEDEGHWLHWLMRGAADEGQLYHWPVVASSVLASIAILVWFQRLSYVHTPEESLQEAIDQRSAHWQAG